MTTATKINIKDGNADEYKHLSEMTKEELIEIIKENDRIIEQHINTITTLSTELATKLAKLR